MEIIVTGSIAYDYLMRFPGSFRQHIMTEALHQVSLSFLVEDMTKHWGGVAANIAFTLAKLGLHPHLMGTVGRDFTDYRQWLELAGVNTRMVRQHDDLFTASFFCNTDLENNQIASFYSGAMALAKTHRLQDVVTTPPDLVIISPNDPQAMSDLSQECRDHAWRFVYDPSQQVARLDGETLRRDMQGAAIMVVNEYESTIICDKTAMSMDQLRATVEVLVVTHGSQGSRIYPQGDVIHVPTFPPTEIKDPTGAGDAFRAGFIAGLMRGLPLKLAGEIGALAATYALEYVGTQNHSYTMTDFVARFRQHQDDQGQLDIFLTS